MALRLELAKSGRSTCKICRSPIACSAPRVGLERDDEFASVAWHHSSCFNWASHNINSASDLSRLLGWTSLPENKQKLFVDSLTPALEAVANVGAKRAGGKEPDTPSKVAKLLPSQLEEQLPLNLGVSVIEYAKPKKPSNCMSCSGSIKNGEPRVGDRQPSAFFEGTQARWMHLACAKWRISRLSQLEGWDRMGYDVNFEIRQKTGELMSQEAEATLKTKMEALEGVQDILCQNLTFDELIAALQANGVNAKDLLIEKDSIAMAVLISDYLAHGTPEDCPVCGCAALVFSAGRITCWGYVQGLSRCRYKATSCTRYKFVLPEGWEGAEWFAELRGEVQAGGKKGKKAGGSKGGKKARAGEKSAITNGLDVREMKMTASTQGDMTSSKHVVDVSEKARGLIAQQLAFIISKAVLSQDSSWTKKKCRENLEELLGAEVVGEHKEFANQEIMRLTEELRGMSAGALASFADEQKGVKKEDVATLLQRPRTIRTPPEEGSPILTVHRGYEQTGRRRYARIVMADDGVDVYNASFTDTNLKTGINRFYVVQLLHLSAPHSRYEIFCHWGRVGSKWEEEAFTKLRDSYQTYPFPLEKKQEAIESFKQWFLKKTGNHWEERDDFRTRPSYYAFVELSTKNSAGAGAPRQIKSGAAGGSSIDPRVESLVELLFDEDTILHSMKCSDINLQELPLGQVTSQRIEQARTILEKVRMLLSSCPSAAPSATAGTDEEGKKGLQDLQIWQSKLEAASTEFWRTIPSTKASVLDTEAKVQERMQVLDTLDDIALAQNLTANVKGMKELLDELRCSIRPLEKSDTTLKLISASLENTSEPAVDKGRMCGFVGNSSVEVLECFELDRIGEADSFSKHADKRDRRLLWHGTNISSAAAIVSSGLRIMGSGGRVGSGIYLADEAGKSGHYVRCSQDGTGVLFLAEAALGRQFELLKETHEAHAFRKAPEGFDSVKAVGKSRPLPSGDAILKLDGNEVRLAAGKSQRVKDDKETSFSQNEYLIYDPTQVRLRYLVLVRLLDPATVGQRPAPTLSALPQTAVQSTSAASLILAGMSEDDMVSAAIAASLGGGAGTFQGGGTGIFQGGTSHQPLVVPDSD